MCMDPYIKKVRHASSILHFLDAISRWVIAHFQKRFWYWLEGGNCWKCWFNKKLFRRKLFIRTADRWDGNLKALRGVNEKNPSKRVNSWLSIFKFFKSTWLIRCPPFTYIVYPSPALPHKHGGASHICSHLFHSKAQDPDYHLRRQVSSLLFHISLEWHHPYKPDNLLNLGFI